ncbi:undecaprenyl-diphosphate phosphatase [Candidatus Dependentiae bacterium]|nr:undecaprenyl-diphosphate phosphatase [Candidatus Dependentiae bacterium]
MNIHKSAIIAAQIIGETLPISSSTHVWIIDTIFRQAVPWTDKIGTESVMDLLFFPTLMVLLLFFRHSIVFRFKILMRFFKQKECSVHSKKWFSLLFRVFAFVFFSLVSFTLTFFSLKKILSLSTLSHPTLAAIGLSCTALLQISTYFIKKNDEKLSFIRAIGIGFFQGFAAIPGISRLSVTLVSARWLSIPTHRAFEFSTLLQLATFLGNPLKNLCDKKIHFFNLYKDHIAKLSFEDFLIITMCAFISFYGLRLSWHLNENRSLWKIAPYFTIPLTLLYLIRNQSFLYFP